MADPILEMRGMKKSFHGVKALSDVNLTVEAGQIHAIVGENGAGKSRLSGRIRLAADVKRLNDRKAECAAEQPNLGPGWADCVGKHRGGKS